MGRTLICSSSFVLAFLVLVCLAIAEEDPDFARYKGFGHMTGLIGNYLSKPDEPFAMEFIGEHRITFYWIARAQGTDSHSHRRTTILVRSPHTKNEHPVDVSSRFKKRLDLEGTGILCDGRLINVLKRGERLRYLDISTTHPTGLGSRNNPLTPFISVAISDSHPKLEFGDRLYIPQVEGTPLPDGGEHDGIFSVDDTGQAIADDQLDLFVFIKKNWMGFQKKLKTKQKDFFVYKLFPLEAHDESRNPRQQPANQRSSQ